MDQNHAGRIKRWLAAAIKLLVVIVVVWFVRGTLVDLWHQLGQHHWEFNLWWLAAAGVLYLLGTLLCGIFWRYALLALGQQVSLLQSLRAYYIGHLGKYVPGKAMVVILRTGLVHGQGIDVSLAAVSVFFETLTMMSSGAAIGAAIVAVSLRGNALLFWSALAIMVVAGAPTLPPVFRRIVPLVGVGRSNPAVIEKLAGLGYGTVLIGWVLTGLGWAILGLSFWAVLRSLGAGDVNPLAQLHLHTAAVALATVAGFVSFVPGGAVVREVVLTELMARPLGNTVALLSAILLRVVWLVSELAISGILYLGGKGLGIRD